MPPRRSSVLCLLVVISACSASVLETKLIEKVLKGYDENALAGDGEGISVHFGIMIHQIISVEERSQIITLKVWYRYIWHDYRLTWDPAKYNNTKDIRLFASRIWRPDITLYSDVLEQHDERAEFYPAKINYRGLVELNLPGLIKSYCRLKLRYVPYDIQVCDLKFGSWSYDMSKLDIRNMSDSADVKFFEPHGEWNLMKVPCRRHELKYQTNHTYSDVTFWLVLERRPLYYIFNLVLPCIFITATTILVFYLPPEGGEKVSLSVTVLLATTVFLLLVAESMPPQSEVIPLIGQYFASIIILMAISTAFTVVVINMHYRGSLGHHVPHWMRVLILQWLASAVCMRKLADSLVPPRDEDETSVSVKINHNGDVSHPNIRDTSDSQLALDKDYQVSNTSEKLLYEIMKTLKRDETEKKAERADGKLKSEWMVVAIVVDRFFMIVFFIITIVVTLSLLINKPSAESVVEIK